MRKKSFDIFSSRFIALFSVGTLLFHGAIAASPLEDGWTREERLAFFSQYLPMTKAGKIDIPSHITSVKFDIGLSENAPMTQVWLAEQENLFVFGIEPNPKANALVLARGAFSDNPFGYPNKISELYEKRFFIIPCALSKESDRKDTIFYVTEEYGCSSLFLPVNLPLKEEIEVPVLTLADFFDIFPFDRLPMIDYIKIDAQGSDLDIVKGAAKYMQERVVSITLEDIEEGYDARYAGSYRGCVNTIRDIDSYMASIGFRKYFTERTYDPTYVNEKFLDYFLSHNELQIFQKG